MRSAHPDSWLLTAGCWSWYWHNKLNMRNCGIILQHVFSLLERLWVTGSLDSSGSKQHADGRCDGRHFCKDFPCRGGNMKHTNKTISTQVHLNALRSVFCSLPLMKDVLNKITDNDIYAFSIWYTEKYFQKNQNTFKEELSFKTGLHTKMGKSCFNFWWQGRK